MSKENVRAIVDANIHENGMQLISGPVMNATLKAIIDDYPEEGNEVLETAVVENDGIVFVDQNLNIGVILDSRGLTSINTITYKEA